MAELHVIGQVVSGTSSETPSTGLFAKWSIHSGRHAFIQSLSLKYHNVGKIHPRFVLSGSSWKKLSGHKEGQTQVTKQL